MDKYQKYSLFSRLFPIANYWKNALYIHIPFCVQRCDFCIYFSKVPAGKSEIREFLERDLYQQIELYDRVLNSVGFNEIYFGGGTPTILPPKDLEKLYDRIPNFDQIALKASEGSPRTIKDEHIDLFASRGFKYVSIGIQSLDQETLISYNREVVEKKRLIQIVRKINESGMISNVDLIFFLKTGTVADLPQAESDLRYVMDVLRPTSITIHSEYHAKKSSEKQMGMFNVIRQAIDRSQEYICINSFLRNEDIFSDLSQGAEYRLMRKDWDFNFYLIGKIPYALRFGYNILAMGEYDLFKLRTNYYYISDFYPKYASASVIQEARSIEKDLQEVRGSLGFCSKATLDSGTFFKSEDDENQFKEILKEEGFPNLELASPIGQIKVDPIN